MFFVSSFSGLHHIFKLKSLRLNYCFIKDLFSTDILSKRNFSIIRISRSVHPGQLDLIQILFRTLSNSMIVNRKSIHIFKTVSCIQEVLQQIQLQFCLDLCLLFCLFKFDHLQVLMFVCPVISELRYYGSQLSTLFCNK